MKRINRILITLLRILFFMILGLWLGHVTSLFIFTDATWKGVWGEASSLLLTNIYILSEWDILPLLRNTLPGPGLILLLWAITIGFNRKISAVTARTGNGKDASTGIERSAEDIRGIGEAGTATATESPVETNDNDTTGLLIPVETVGEWTDIYHDANPRIFEDRTSGI
ncbi:hypothetical protein TspCOW1_13080 [Thiohalobacter sp. COW1]|uniref:hypothetical protein n=1 Tax=Thiohalobacter sp. COW1 TaxID=2795687 RepID=UPI001915A978|nr:hypothetical protein [Thiohalobacter sp. COW1]BCO31205.1 hypothetical protein TspCOW1_13080 [Thiohalobacter sp. COW1]